MAIKPRLVITLPRVMKKIFVIIYTVLLGSFCIEMIHDMVKTADLTYSVSAEKNEPKKEEKKEDLKYKDGFRSPALINPELHTVYGMQTATTPQPGYFEIVLPPPDFSC